MHSTIPLTLSVLLLVTMLACTDSKGGAAETGPDSATGQSNVPPTFPGAQEDTSASETVEDTTQSPTNALVEDTADPPQPDVPVEDTADPLPALPAFNKKKFHPDFKPGNPYVIEGEPSDYYAEIATFPEQQRYRRYADVSITDEGLVSYSGLNLDVPPVTGPLTPRNFATPTPTLCDIGASITVSSFGYSEIAPQTYQYDGKAIAIVEMNHEVAIPKIEYSSASLIKERLEIVQDPTGRAALRASDFLVEQPDENSLFYVQYQMTAQNQRVSLLVGRGPQYPDSSFDGQVVRVSRRLLSESCSAIVLYKFKITGVDYTGTDSVSVSNMKAGTMQKRIQVPPNNTIPLGLFTISTSFGTDQWTYLISSVGTTPSFCYLENMELKTTSQIPMSAKESNPAFLSPLDMIAGRKLDLTFRTDRFGGDRRFSMYAKYYLESGPDTICKGL